MAYSGITINTDVSGSAGDLYRSIQALEVSKYADQLALKEAAQKIDHLEAILKGSRTSRIELEETLAVLKAVIKRDKRYDRWVLKDKDLKKLDSDGNLQRVLP